MSENFGVLLEAKLDEIKSGKTIEAQLKSMGQRIDSLPIGFNIDVPSVTKQFNGLVKVLESHIGQAGDALNEVFSTTRILKYKDTLGSTVKDYQKLNQETGKFETQNRTITEDAEKQKSIIEEQSRIYQRIKSTLDSLPDQFKGATATQDLYSMLDPNDGIDNLKALQNITDNYYKEVIALEKQYQSTKESTNKDTIDAFKQQESKVDFIYQKRKQLLDLERQINALSTTKGVNTNNYLPDIDNLRSTLTGYSATGTNLYPEQRQEILQIIDTLKQKLALEKDSLNVQKLQEESQIKINNARQNLNDIIAKNGTYDNTQFENLNGTLGDLENKLKNNAISAQEFNLEMKKLSPEMKQFETEARQASASTSTLSSRFKRFLSFYSFYDALELGKRLIREVASEVKLLDDSLLEVNKILNLSTNEMDSFVKKAYEMGESISRTGRDAVDAVGVMVKSGFSDIDQALGFAKLSLAMKNVGDNMNDVERNANVLISTMKGFGDESYAFAEKTLNVLNEVSNTSAITFNDLAESFTRTSAVYAQAGVSIEELAGLATGANEIIQNIEKSSSGLLIISQRIQGVTTAFEEDPENLSQVDKALQKIAGISVRDTNGELRDTYEILSDVAKIYDNLSSVNQSALAEIIAGKRQRSVFEALMANWNKVEKATESAMNSAGSYAKEQEAYFNSISGHLARLESAWQSLATSSLDADFTKSLVDMVTWTVKLIDNAGGLQTVLLGLIASFVSFKAVLSIDFLKNIVTQFSLLAKTANVAGKAVTTLSLAGKLLIGASVVGGVMAIGYAVNYIATSSERAEKELKTLSNNLSDLKNTTKNISDLSDRFKELKDNIKTDEELQEFTDTQNQLKELLPSLKGFYDEKGNFNIALEEENSNLQELIDKQDVYIEQQREILSLQAKKTAKNTINDYDKEKERLNDLLKLQELNKRYADGEKLTRQEQQKRFNLSNYLGINIGATASEIEKTRDSINKSIDSMSEKFTTIISDTKEWSALTVDTQNAVRKAWSEQDDDFIAEWTIGIEDGSRTFKEFLKTISNTDSFKNYIQLLEDSKNKTNEFGESLKTLKSSIEDLSNTRSKIESLQNILNNLNEDNFTASNMEELLSISEEFLPYLNDEIALREKLTQSIGEYKDSYQKSYNDILNTSTEFYNTKIKGDNELYSKLSNNIKEFFNGLGLAYEGDLKNYTNLENAKAKLTSQIVSQIAGDWAGYFNAFTGELLDPRIGWGAGALGENSELIDTYNKIQTARDKLLQVVNDTVYTPIDIKFDESKSKGKDKHVEAFQKQYDELKYLRDKDLISAQQYYNGLKSLNNKYFAGNSKYIDQFRQYDLELYNLQKELAEKHIENVINSYEKANKKIERSITQLDLQQQLVGDNSQEYIDIEQKKYDEIVKLETELQRTISELQAIGTEEAKQQAEEYIDVYYDTVSQRNSIIKNLQSSQISLFESQIEDLEKQKSALEDLHKFTMQMIKDELNAKKKSLQEDLKGIEAVFNAKKKALRDEQDSRSYEKGLTEKSSLVADLENQLAIIKNDETAIAKRKQLEQELAKAKEDLANYQYEHSIDLQEKALDSELEKVKQTYEDRIEELDETLSNEVRLRELADKKIKQSGEKLYKELINYSKEYGSITKDEIKNAWDNANISLKGYKDTQEDVLDKLKEVTAELGKIENLNLNDYSNKSGLSTKNAEQTKAEMKVNSAKWLEASKNNDTKKMEDMARANQELGNAMGWYYDPVTGIWWENKNKKVRIYHSGGIVGGNNYATKSTEELAKLLKGELVITPPEAKTALDMITNNSNSEISISIPIIIEGNADSDTVKAFEKQVNKLADVVIDKLNTARTNTGFKKKPKFV